MKKCDPTKPPKFISDFDMNNLYGSGMSEFLPYGGFKWIKNVDNFDVDSVREKNPIGYITEVDLEYPDELHELHNDYLVAPEKLAIPYDIIAKNYRQIWNKVGDVKKLIPNLGDKTNYVVHYRNLQLCLPLGMKLTKIHKLLKFKWSDWMKNYANFNTEKRTNAANTFEKYFLKLMINSVYGKTMESLQKRINVKLVNNKKVFLKCTSRPTHITFRQKLFCYS